MGCFEYATIADMKSGHALKAVDVHISRNKNKILLILHSSKTHTKGSKPQLIKIEGSSCGTKGRNGKYCPFLALREYIRFRRSVRNEDEQFFVYQDRNNVKATVFNTVLKKTIKSLGLRTEYYSLHCFRSGCMTDMHNMGIPLNTIQRLGRWKSNAVYTYIR